ncbi:hypothetical protein WJX77_001846 [Trebouxia sp. C0004]
MSGYCLHAAQTGTTISLHAHSRKQSFSQTAFRHQQIQTATALSRRTCKYGSKHGRLTILAASSTDETVRRSNDPIRSAQDVAEGLQDFLDEAQRSLGTDEAPLPEHPIGEAGTIDVAEGLDAGVIRVPSDFFAREGLKLTPEYTVGKEIGGGVQGRVLALNGPDGEKTNKLLKVMKYKLATPMTGLDVGLKREWLIGQQLNTLTGKDGQLHGFMGTGACLLDKETDMPCGLIIEKVNGIPCEKRLTKDESFADVRYLLEMCKQVFGYLHEAWDKIGFTHGFTNDHETQMFKLPGDDEPEQLEFRIIDYGHARLAKNKALAKLPKAPGLERSYRKWWEGKGDVWRLLQDMAVTIDGRTWPAEEEAHVRMLIGLIRKVTGVTISAFFKGQMGYKYSGREMEMPWHSRSGFGHNIRKYRMRIWAFSFKRNTQIKPIEALQWMRGNEEYYKVKYGGSED